MGQVPPPPRGKRKYSDSLTVFDSEPGLSPESVTLSQAASRRRTQRAFGGGTLTSGGSNTGSYITDPGASHPAGSGATDDCGSTYISAVSVNKTAKVGLKCGNDWLPA